MLADGGAVVSADGGDAAQDGGTGSDGGDDGAGDLTCQSCLSSDECTPNGACTQYAGSDYCAVQCAGDGDCSADEICSSATAFDGQQVSVCGYTLTFTGTEQRQLSDHSELVAAMRFGDETLQPARATYVELGGQSLTRVAISTTPVADVYVILAGANADGSASFRVLVNPLVSWIWAGGLIIILGVILGNVGERRAAPVFALKPAPQAAVS